MCYVKCSFSLNEEENLMETKELHWGSTSQDEKIGLFLTSKHQIAYPCLYTFVYPKNLVIPYYFPKLLFLTFKNFKDPLITIIIVLTAWIAPAE